MDMNSILHMHGNNSFVHVILLSWMKLILGFTSTKTKKRVFISQYIFLKRILTVLAFAFSNQILVLDIFVTCLAIEPRPKNKEIVNWTISIGPESMYFEQIFEI